MLAEGRDGWTEVPKDRWDWRSFYHKDPETKEAIHFSHGYFLNKDLSGFDARFFGIPTAEATAVDPQQRLLLEVTYEALEDAGIPMENLRGSNTSVHMAMVSIPENSSGNHPSLPFFCFIGREFWNDSPNVFSSRTKRH